MLACNFGVLMAFVLGHYVDYTSVPLLIMFMTAAFMLSMSLQHETPPYLLQAGLIKLKTKLNTNCGLIVYL